ncbi:VOC family protein [Kitasatospora sp. MBT63]|uniref:VOC family protein n=1 Tax=Kitasatospora sp. MBT63 TaxID=1444768 RepID=UPI00053A9082|nr:VOC family protein [Kitasatospora sp. MBT63]
MVTTDFRTGSPNWLDLGSPDPGAAAAFYGAVFGWSFASAGPQAGGYGFFQQGGRTVAALGPLTEPGAVSAWTLYFLTPDADATAKGVEQGGGTVRMAPGDVFDAGRMTAFTDPTGGQFAVWQPARTKGLDEVGAPGSFVWAELHSADVPRALAFYRGVFGWRTQEFEGSSDYVVLSTADGDQQEAGFGGAAPLHAELSPGWLPYFATEDPDAVVAAATAGGGSVVVAAADVPGAGRLAVLKDPFGAAFAVLRPDPRM